MSTSLVPIETTRLWGGVKIPFTPEAKASATLNVTVSIPAPLVGLALKPVFSYLTDATPETVIPDINVPFPVTIALGATFLEFRVSFPNQSTGIYSAAWRNPVNAVVFTVTAQPFDQVFLNFGVREYRVHMRTEQPINGLRMEYVQTSNSPEEAVLQRPLIAPRDLDGIFRAHYAVFKCSQYVVKRDFIVKFRDINDRAFTAGLSEGDLPLYPWDNSIAPWPAFSSPSNILGPDYPNGQNFMVYHTTTLSTDDPQAILDSLVPATGNFTDGFLIPSTAAIVVLRRTYMLSTVATALANAQSANPSVLALNDCMIVSIEDAARHNPTFGGKLLRYLPKTRIVVGVEP